jgi:hypothetical protein
LREPSNLTQVALEAAKTTVAIALEILLSAIQRRNVIEARGDVGVIGSPPRAKLLIGTAL